jgi:hypothetical protein
MVLAGALLGIRLANVTAAQAIGALTVIALVSAVDRCCSGPRVVRAILQSDGSWILFISSTDASSACLSRSWGESHGPVIALQWLASGGHRYSAWVVASDLPERDRRRLRARLRLS